MLYSWNRTLNVLIISPCYLVLVVLFIVAILLENFESWIFESLWNCSLLSQLGFSAHSICVTLSYLSPVEFFFNEIILFDALNTEATVNSQLSNFINWSKLPKILSSEVIFQLLLFIRRELRIAVAYACWNVGVFCHCVLRISCEQISKKWSFLSRVFLS